MSSPGIRPRKNQPAAGPGGNKDSPHTLRMLSADGDVRAAAPSIAMPRAKTELSEILAGDKLLCVRRGAPAAATRGNADAGSSVAGADAGAQAESPATGSGKRGSDASPQAHLADADLGLVIHSWSRLPHNARAAILAMIRETAAGDA